jgi:hypothetical protein
MTHFASVHGTIAAQVVSRELGGRQPQDLSFEFKRDYNRVIKFLSVFCVDGNLDATMQQALEYYIVSCFADDDTKEKARQLTRMVISSANVNPDRHAIPPDPNVSAGEALGFNELKAVLGKNLHGALELKTDFGIDVTDVPPFPREMTPAFFNALCDVIPGKFRKDTHIVCLRPKGVSLKDFEQICKARGYTLLRGTDWTQDKPYWTKKPQASEWVMLLNTCVPGTKNLDYAQQDPMLARYPQYRTAFAGEFYLPLAVHIKTTGEYPFSNEWGWLADETSSGVRALGGDSCASGVSVSFVRVDHRDDVLGRAACRKF